MEYYAHSDLGNAKLLGDLHGSHLKYRADTQEWLHWDKGNHWQTLDREEELRFAGDTAKKRFDFVAQLNLEQQKKESSWALQSQSLGRMQAMLTIARSQEPIRSPGTEWNKHPLLLATPNGVVDLTTGNFRSGKRDDYISQHIDIDYDSKAICPRWFQFLDEIFAGDQTLIDYIQRAVGYAITGSTKEQVFFLLYGTGSNGKSKFRNILSNLLGHYSHTVRFSAFEENALGDAQRDLAELEGIRCVFASEGSEKKKLDTSVLKYITGEEPIRTSRKYGHPFTFHPQFKIWLSSNYLPRVDDNSYGFWRRIIVIPFNVKFEGQNRDSSLEDKLIKELPGILNWAIEGASIWFKQGLRTPDQLLLQVSKYKDAQDTLSKFITDECETGLDLRVAASELYQGYLFWCMDNKERPITSTSFGTQITARFTKKRTSLGMVYEGIDLKEPLPI